MRIKRLTPELIVKNIRESVDFYVNMLGFEMTNSVGEGTLVWANVMWPGSEVGLMFMTPESMGEEITEFRNKDIGGSVVQYIEVEGLDGLYEKIKGKVEIVSEKHTTFYGSREFSIKDNSGYILMFSERDENKS